uniref:Protein kinase domain-containing protein n=1 Tax=Haptolina brevifila TaxID=156173 RepID=A0A7S2DMW0_9EUKA|mmetsp:Transcript_41338/g.82825  ORF Transcript_41338/g.82825 Transcript_41338/m.82825 type:complete len:379 (+) Transcript_41338:941-2077(+)
MLGQGSFGSVALVADPAGVQTAVKRVPRASLNKRERQLLINERRALSDCRHPFVSSLLGTLRLREALYLQLDYCQATLYDVLERQGPIQADHAALLAGCVASALDHVHECGWVHRDLNSENVMFTSSRHLKLIDFGLATTLPPGPPAFQKAGARGIPDHVAPELLSGGLFGRALDWWSFGCLLYAMLIGHTPWVLDDHARREPADCRDDAGWDEVYVDRVLCFSQVPYPASLEVQLSDAARALIASLLVRDPSLRLGHDGGAQVFAHAFFSRVAWAELRKGTLAMPHVCLLPPPPAYSTAAATPNGASETVVEAAPLSRTQSSLRLSRRSSMSSELSAESSEDEGEDREAGAWACFFAGSSLDQGSEEPGEDAWDRYF